MVDDEHPERPRTSAANAKKKYRVSTERHPYCMAIDFFDDLEDLDDANDQDEERGGALNRASRFAEVARITTFTTPASRGLLAAAATSADRQRPATAQASRGDEHQTVLAHVVSATSIAKGEEEVGDEHPIIAATAKKRKYSPNAAWEAQDRQEDTVDATAAPSLRRNVSHEPNGEVDPSTRTTTQNKKHCSSNNSSLPSLAHSGVSTGLSSPHVTRRKTETSM